MAGLKSSSMLVVFVMMMVASSTMAQTSHVVGGSVGWAIPSSNGVYGTWASGQTFNVGDSLVFNFTTGMHNVLEVAQAAYGPCTITNPISTATTGPATIQLTTAGTHYFVCGVGQHCQFGQKVSVNVVAAAAAPATPPPAAAPTTAPPTATPTPTTTPTPAPVSPPTTTPAPAPGPSTTTPPTATPAPSPDTDTTSPPSPTPTGPSAGPTTGPPPTGDNTPTPPSPSAAAAITVGVPATFLAVALALFY
ncbi:cucumber peeling cupredoxin-like protein [Tanacetum coccineum]